MYNSNINYGQQVPMASTVPVQGSPMPHTQPPAYYPVQQPYPQQPSYGVDQTSFSAPRPLTPPAPAVEVGFFDKVKSYFNDVYRSDDNLRAYKAFQQQVDTDPHTLKPGDRSQERIMDLQQKLNIAGIQANVNGVYGYATGEAVKDFKRMMNINDGFLDGKGNPAITDIATPQMQTVLNSVVSKQLNPQMPGTGNPMPVTQEELLWAQNLATRIQSFGYQPNTQERGRYEDILARQQAQSQPGIRPPQGSPTIPGVPMPGQMPPQQPVYQQPVQHAPQAPQVPAGSQVSQHEMDWAFAMQERIMGGYRPTPQEAAMYENIQQRASAAPSQTAPQPSGNLRPVTQAELDWAVQMQNQIAQGYQPSAEEAARYTDIYNRYQNQPVQAEPTQPTRPVTPQAPAYNPGHTPSVTIDNSVSQQELQWAVDLQHRVDTQGYRPTQQDIVRYTDIYHRYQASQAEAAAQAAAQPLPVQVQPTQPGAHAPTQPQQPVRNPGASHDEVQWARRLESRVSQGHQATPEEIARYNEIQLKLATHGVSQTQGPGSVNAPSSTGPVSQAEIDWALQLQHRVQFEGYQPSDQEVAAYTDIFTRYQQQGVAGPPQQPMAPQPPVQQAPQVQPVAPALPSGPPSAAEVQWAQQLQTMVQQGYQASPEEIAQYTNIYERMQQAQGPQQPPAYTQQPVQPQQPPGSVMINVNAADHEMQWALELLSRYRQGYQPSQTELMMYERIIAGKAVPGATP